MSNHVPACARDFRLHIAFPWGYGLSIVQCDMQAQSLVGLGPPCTVSIELADKDTRSKQTIIREGVAEQLYVFTGDDNVNGEVSPWRDADALHGPCFGPIRSCCAAGHHQAGPGEENRAFRYQDRVYWLDRCAPVYSPVTPGRCGVIMARSRPFKDTWCALAVCCCAEMFYGNQYEFTSLVRELDAPGELAQVNVSKNSFRLPNMTSRPHTHARTHAHRHAHRHACISHARTYAFAHTRHLNHQHARTEIRARRTQRAGPTHTDSVDVWPPCILRMPQPSPWL